MSSRRTSEKPFSATSRKAAFKRLNRRSASWLFGSAGISGMLTDRSVRTQVSLVSFQFMGVETDNRKLKTENSYEDPSALFCVVSLGSGPERGGAGRALRNPRPPPLHHV